MENLRKLFEEYFGCRAESVLPITGSGSGRQYFRLSGCGKSAIGCIGVDVKENETFLYLAEALRRGGNNVPKVLAIAADRMTYLQEDLGDASLFSMLNTPDAEVLVGKTMEALPHVQLCDEIDADRLYPVKELTKRHCMYDLNYFKYCFLKPAGAVMDEDLLENEFEALCKQILATKYQGYMYRDCQSRNILIHDGEPWWIDFQSMRRGPLLYDIASFLWQARAGFTSQFRQTMAERYFEALCKKECIKDAEFPQAELELMVLFRTLQVLGAYGLRGLTERKAHFVESIIGALNNVRELLSTDMLIPYPELRRCLQLCVDNPRFKKPETAGRLLVTVFSFSYKLGYPEDFSGNGGGFMFDCRALHNPGRYEEYKPLTGRDKPVITFLEERGEIQGFLKAAAELIDPAVERYIKRGFSSLQIGFGCTGGRHRSVYSAEHIARHIAEKFGDKVVVRLIHREQKIDEIL